MNNSFFDIDPFILETAKKAEEDCKEQFALADEICSYNSQKVLKSFIDNRVSESYFGASTGYGYGDRGREVLDEVFAQIVGAEDALIRYNFMSGTHTLAVALFGILRPNDLMVSLTGTPYDTLHGVIGIKKDDSVSGSLMDFGVKYEELPLTDEGLVDFEGIKEAVKGAKVAYIQRSRGYSLRKSLCIADIDKIIKNVRSVNKDAVIMVDNCYGEFVETKEPTQVGADIIVGSLIKNPGGGIAPTGGYIAGKKEYVDMCAQRLSAPGVGKEIGCTLGNTRSLYMGLFFAPSVVASAVKTAILASAMYESFGYEVTPTSKEKRGDII
ncbi:MAG: methionine gamma-lyase family protein, partial [Oscillospiraceae bacterium]